LHGHNLKYYIYPILTSGNYDPTNPKFDKTSSHYHSMRDTDTEKYYGIREWNHFTIEIFQFPKSEFYRCNFYVNGTKKLSSDFQFPNPAPQNHDQVYWLRVGGGGSLASSPQAGGQFLGAFKGLSIFANTGVSNYCPKGCLRCTKDFDCLFAENSLEDGRFLTGFSVASKCPNKYARDARNSGDRTCYDDSKKSLQFDRVIEVNDYGDSS
jgi:hypothetical protein